MSYMRSSVVDASITGDSVKQAILDLDADVSLSFIYLNQLGAIAAQKIPSAEKDAPRGVAGLDDSGLLQTSQVPSAAKIPVGALMLWPTGSVPPDYLECNGAELAVADYADLFLVIGYAYGGLGDSFGLPDWRGRFPRVWDHGAGIDPDAETRTGGDAVGSIQAGALGSHVHLVDVYDFRAVGGAHSAYGDWVCAPGASDGGSQHNALACGASETRPVNMAVMVCIKWR
jgi:microcystin-dependent protein